MIICYLISEQVVDGQFKYKLEDILKLRSAFTEDEKAAFLWFAGEFVECVAGKMTWGKVKYKKLMSEGMREGEKALVSATDEAFALLMIKNYQERWILEKTEKDENRSSAKELRARKGLYTGAKTGNQEFKGWTRAGMCEYGRLLQLVKNDRLMDSGNKMMEKWVRAELQKTAVGKRDNKGLSGEQVEEDSEENTAALFNEADFDD